MTQRNNAADLEPLISREHAENAFRRAMNLFVGRGRLYSVAQLSKGARVPERTIECFRSYNFGHPDYRPMHFGHQLSIAKFLGAEFSTEWMALADQGAFDLPDAGDPDPGALAVENSEDNATVTRAAINGEFEPEERPDLKVVGTRMMARGATLVAIGSKAA